MEAKHLALFRTRSFRFASVLVIVLLVCAGFLGAYALNYSQNATLEVKAPLEVSPPIVPSNIVNYVPIQLNNSQKDSTAIPFQQMITVNSSSFKDYEATNLQNILFFDANGQIIPSWLESGNSNSANETVYWLKVTDGIPANSSVTVYMGFTSKETCLFNNQTTGEAPTLSPNYGEYDNGANIFLFYDNFNGTSLSSQWLIMHSEGSLTVNDGLTVVGSGHDWQSTGSVNAFNPQNCVFDAYAYFTTLSGSVVAEHPGPTVSIGWDVPYGPSQEDSPQYYLGDLADSYALYNCASGVATGSTIAGGSTSNYNIWSVWEETNQSCLSLSYGLERTTSNQNFNASVSSHFGLSSLGSSEVNVQWVRIRSLPCNEAMPTVMLGDVVNVNY